MVKTGVIDIKKVETIENGPQVLLHSPKIAQKQVLSSHKPSETPMSSCIKSSTPTKVKMIPSHHNELAQATATSPQPFSPPAPSPAPKPPEIDSTQPVLLPQHPNISSTICIATLALQVPEILGSQKNLEKSLYKRKFNLCCHFFFANTISHFD